MKCEKLSKKYFPLPPEWICTGCTMKTLPFANINDENMKLTSHGLSDETIDFIVDKSPSFSVKSLLDQMPGQKIDTDQFLNNTILSKYYTISEFLSAKFSTKNFSVFHLNISSLQKHIDELRTLLTCTNCNFDIICISETRLHNGVPLSNIQIDGYNFVHTPTLTQCGGSGIYIKNGIEYTILDKLSLSHENICESVFVELKHPTKRNVIIGSIYRHHTTVQSFLYTFFLKTLQSITKTKKTCILAGDFNVDLIQYGDNKKIDEFYDELSSHSFHPLILQPSRVT